MSSINFFSFKYTSKNLFSLLLISLLCAPSLSFANDSTNQAIETQKTQTLESITVDSTTNTSTETATVDTVSNEINSTGTNSEEIISEAITQVQEVVVEQQNTPYLLDVISPTSALRQKGEWQSILPSLGYYIDTDAQFSVSDIARIEKQNFKSYSDLGLTKEHGITWLHLAIPTFTLETNEHIYIELGDSIQGISKLWFKPKNGNLFAIPPLAQSEKGHSYIVKGLSNGGELYVAIEGIPNLWFNPAIKLVDSTKDIPTNGIYNSNAYKLYLLVALAILSILTFLRFLTERGEWRFWAGIFGLSACVLHYFGIPSTPKGIIASSEIISLIALSAILFSLVTFGRLMMSLPKNWKGLNLLFILLSLLGLAAGLAPLSTSYTWLVRYADFWQIISLVLIAPTILCILKVFRGSLSYLTVLLCLFMGALLGYYGMDKELNSSLFALAPLLGTAISVFILFITPANIDKNVGNNIDTSNGYSPDMDYKVSDTTDDQQSNSPLNTKAEENESLFSTKGRIVQNLEDKEIEDTAEIYYDYTTSFENAQTFTRIEQAFRVPLDSFMRELCFLEQQIDFVQGIENQNHKEKALVHTQTLLSVGKDINMLANSLPKMLARKPMQNSAKIPFNIQDILRQVYEKVRYEAASSQIALSWFRSPSVGLWYTGDKNALATLLYQLLSDSIRATKHGIVYIRVERDEASNDHGRLLFTIGDSGQGNPPQRRAASLLSKVWELTSAHNGTFNVESNEKGTEYKFILELKALEDDGVTEKPMPNLSCAENPIHNPKLVHITAPDAFERHMFSFRLERMDLQIIESMDIHEAILQYKSTPSAITVIGADYDLIDIANFISEIRDFEQRHNLKSTIFIGLYNTEDEKHASIAYELQSNGCSYTVSSNERRLVFRKLIEKLLDGEKPKSIYNEAKVEDVDNEKEIIEESKPNEEVKNQEDESSPLTGLTLNIDNSSATKKEYSKNSKKKEESPKLKFALCLHAEDSNEEVEEIEIKVNEEGKITDPFYINHNQEVDLPSFRNKDSNAKKEED